VREIGEKPQLRLGISTGLLGQRFELVALLPDFLVLPAELLIYLIVAGILLG
jgi:hypothetical protein